MTWMKATNSLSVLFIFFINAYSNLFLDMKVGHLFWGPRFSGWLDVSHVVYLLFGCHA